MTAQIPGNQYSKGGTMRIAYAITGQEFNAQEQLEAIGITCHVPRQVELVRKGKRRWPDPVVTPFLQNYLFIEASDEDHYAIKDCDLIRPTQMVVAGKIMRDVLTFIDRVESDYSERMGEIEELQARIKRSDASEAEVMAIRQRLAEYRPGDLLEIIAGPFAGQLARFGRMIEAAHEAFPQIEAEMEVMGMVTRTKIDPIAARKAG